MTPGKVYGCSEAQVVSKSFWFLWNFKNAQKIFENPVTSFC